MKNSVKILALLMALLMFASCTPANNETSGDASSAPIVESYPEPEKPASSGNGIIKGIDAENYPWIDGSTANHPLLAKIYETVCGVDKDTSESMIAFNLGSTGSIWEDFFTMDREIQPDLLIVYEPPEEVKKEYKDKFKDYEIDPLGRDGLVFMANTQNPVNDLSVKQLFDIYTGKITNWNQVGGNDEAIKPFQRNADSGSQTLFMKLLMDGKEPMDPPTELKQATMGGLIDAVAEYDGEGSSIGYSVYYYANLMHANPSLKLLSVDGVAPSNESIENGTYPLTNDFYVVIRASESEDSPVRELRDWLLSDEGRKILEDANYVWARTGMDAVSVGTDNIFTK